MAQQVARTGSSEAVEKDNSSDEGHLNTPGIGIPKSKQRYSDLFTIFCAGFALISDGYQNNLMTMLNVIFKAEYPKQYTAPVATRVSNALLIGEIIGQVVIGFCCDYMGRKFAIVFTTLMIVLGSIMATASAGTTIDGMFWMMTVARGVVGFGAGGEYPASSASASEAANESHQSRRGPIFILVTNLPLASGGAVAVSIFLIVFSAAGYSHYTTVWRVCFAIGIFLPLTVFYFRLKMLNSKLYRRGAIKKRVPYGLVLRYYWKTLIGTAGAWFLYDFVIFPNGVFSGTIIKSIVGSNGGIKKTAEYQLLLYAIALPGVFVGAWLCDKIGRKNTMMLGFTGYLVFGLVIGITFEKIQKIVPLFVIMYGGMMSMGNLGPGDMLGLISSESYATAVRGTCYGLSAAIGKAGAAIGTQAFTPIQQHGKKWTFITAACCGVVGVVVTWIFVPDLKGEDLAIEDEKFRAYLISKGWTGMMGEDDLQAAADEGIPEHIRAGAVRK